MTANRGQAILEPMSYGILTAIASVHGSNGAAAVRFSLEREPQRGAA